MRNLLAEPKPEDMERIRNACKHHTPDQPTGYIAWFGWAQRMSKTHRQIKCEGCGLYQVWVPKIKREK